MKNNSLRMNVIFKELRCQLRNSLTPVFTYFCLMKMFIGEPVSFQFSRILFSRKRL